jgi:hypothetical protein
MFPLTITLHDAAQLNAVMAALHATLPSPQIALPLAEPTKPTKAKAEPKAEKLTATQTAAMDDTAGLEKPGNAQPAATASSEPTASAAKADAPAQKAVTYAELQAKVLALHKRNASAAKPIAEAMGFPNFKAMPEDKWGEALERVEAALVAEGA